MGKLAIFPAAGALGSSIYTHLLEWVAPTDAILISRHPEKIPSRYVEAGLETRKADYNSPETLERAFDGVSCLVLVSYPSLENEERVVAHKLAIDAALHSSPGVSHIFYTSLAFGGDRTPNSAAAVMQAHLATEKYLQSLASASSSETNNPRFTFTAIREGIYAESFPMYTGFFSLSDPISEVRIPHDGTGPGIAWAKIDELGEATARLITQYHQHPFPEQQQQQQKLKNTTILLSGPKSWTLAETVKLLSEVTGKEIKLVQVSVEEHIAQPRYRAGIGSHGRGDPAREWVTIFEAIKEGETDVVQGDLGRLLGREPQGFESVVRGMMGK